MSRYKCLFVLVLLYYIIINAESKDYSSFKETEERFKKGYFLPPENWRYGADSGWREPTVFVPIFVRNKAHALPYFLNCLSNLDYPKSRMSLWIATDHNSDNSTEILEKWVESVKGEYHELVLEKPETEWFYENQTSNLDWPKERHIHMLQLRQAGLVKAREKWSDYVLYIDADNMLVNPYTLQQLISKDVAIVAPMLTTIASYSNFWAAQDENGYYERADNYFTIRNRVEQGLFEVPMVHSTFLVNLVNRKSRKIQFWPLHEDYHLDLDDIIVFSIHAKLADISLYVDNTFIYGCMPIPLSHHKTLIEEVEVFTHFLMEIMSRKLTLSKGIGQVAGYIRVCGWLVQLSSWVGGQALSTGIVRHIMLTVELLELLQCVDDWFIYIIVGGKLGFINQNPEPPVGIAIEIQPIETLKTHVPASNLGFDKIFMINLERREDRYYRMATALQLQGISFSHFKAIDSKSLNTTYLKGMGIDMLPGYVDPYRERTLTRGEIGCFLSHYFIWQEVVEKRMKKVIVFEDDLRFEVSFNRRLENVMREIEDADLEWDLIYLGRKRMQVKVPEKRVDGCPSLVEADYSYWTLAYALSLSGAQKLLDGKPLHRMVPVDEYLPIMFNKHPIAKYMEPFKPRDLKAFSVEPLYVYPTHYTGQINYFSDTETSSIWEDVLATKEEL